MENSEMNRSKQSGAMFMGSKPHNRALRLIGKSTVAALCALTLAIMGCSQKAGKAATVVAPGNTDNPDVKKVVSKLDSLVKQNAGKGKGVITGFLTGEGKTVAKGLLKQASNAGGERRLLVKDQIPLTGATILIFDALKPTTAADTTLTTDSLGNYTCILKEGKYFGFAVHLDLETFQLVTTGIPNMNPKADTIVHMDTATAIEDVTAPTVSGVYDANTANSDGIFLVGSVPDKNAKINITFSEPMNRESIKGVVLGKIDTTNTSTSMVLADTVKNVGVSWSGDSKVATLSMAALTTGVQYGLIIPTGLKDLAKNPLDKEYKATFVTVAAAELAAIKFAVVASVPADKETIKPIQNPGVSFNRPVEAFSLIKFAKIEPAVTGYWEVSGARAVFIHKDALTVGTTYTLTLPATVTDQAGAGLASDFSFTFTIKDFQGAAKDNSGREKDVALAVEAAFDAYVSGDIGRFATSFHPNFRLYDEDGGMKSKSEFLDKIRAEVGDKQALAAGFDGPVFDNSPEACKDGGARWKVGAEGGTADDQIWVDAYVNPGQSPRVFDKDKKEIMATDLTWDPTGPRFTIKSTGKKYGFGPDLSRFKGPVNMDAAKNDQRFMADQLKQTSTVVLEAIKFEGREEFNVDPSVTLSGDTARLAVKMISYEKYNRVNFGDIGRACGGSLTDTSFQILKFTLVNDGSKWLVMSIVSPSKQTNKDDFNKAVDTKDFKIKQIMPITLTTPLKENAQGDDGKVTFKFKGPALDSIGGYLVGIAEDPKFCFGRAPYGALIFVKASNTKGNEETLVLNSAGGPEGNNAASILRRVQDLKLPGWDRTIFDNALTTLYKTESGFGGVYNWKVIGVKDTSAVQFLANGYSPDRYFAESDFGPNRGYFACKGFPSGAAFNTLENNQQKFVSTQPNGNNNGSFSDMDLDGVPDAIEAKYKTDPRDRNSYPDFRTDTDNDGLADFLEAMLDPQGTDSLVTKKADAPGVKAEIAKLIAMGIVWQDTDGDGFPDDIEMLSGFNPNDPKNNPGTRPRASAPSGVFAGKFQMGSNLNSITFKLFTDTSKALWVFYTAVIGKDTLSDSVRTSFNEAAGEVYVPVTLLKNGPDAGRALLLRGHYDAISSLLMGPIDMIPAPAKTSTNFGGGPNVGQFAASGRGEDVSRYLPASGGGNTGTAVNNPVNTVVNNAITYRLPPSGTKEGAFIILADGKVSLVDEFGDTVAVIENPSIRAQSDGSYEFFGEKKSSGANNSTKRAEVGGRIAYDNNGSWIVDGHFFQESDSSGVHKSIPGQINGKAAKADITPAADGITGKFKGWIFQDTQGNGIAAQPVNNTPSCDPAKGPCTTNPNPACDPAKGPCTTNPNPACDPSKGPCGNSGTTPVTSFLRSFMSGAASFRTFVANAGVKPNEFFYLSINNRVYRVMNDSAHVMDAKSPMCGQVVLVPEAVPAVDESPAAKAAYSADSMSVSLSGSNLVLLMEDQFRAGAPNRLDKAFDAQGVIRANVFVAEIRPASPDYGHSTMVCPVNGSPVNPACDPGKGPCPVDTNKVACDPAKSTCPQPACDPAKGPCGPVTGGFKTPPLYKGALDLLKIALSTSNNRVGLVKDSMLNLAGKVDVNPASMAVEPNARVVSIMDAAGASKYLLLSANGDSLSLLIKEGMPLVVLRPADSGAVPNNPPKDSTPVVNNPPKDSTPIVNNPPSDTGRPEIYTGSLDNLKNLLNAKQNKVMVASSSGAVPAQVNPQSVVFDGKLTTAFDANSSIKVYVFLGVKGDPTKPMLGPDGSILVAEKSALAGI